jgi:hypothetical protein
MLTDLAEVREFPDSIEVTAVAHAARDPEYWLKRK